MNTTIKRVVDTSPSENKTLEVTEYGTPKGLALQLTQGFAEYGADEPGFIQLSKDDCMVIIPILSEWAREQDPTRQVIKDIIKTYQANTPEIVEQKKWSEIPLHIDMLIKELLTYKQEENMPKCEVKVDESPENRNSIYTWARQTFGDVSLLDIALRMTYEVPELLSAIHDLGQHNNTKDYHECILMECADIRIMLAQIERICGAPYVGDPHVDNKMKLNRIRTWSNKNGKMQHDG